MQLAVGNRLCLRSREAEGHQHTPLVARQLELARHRASRLLPLDDWWASRLLRLDGWCRSVTSPPPFLRSDTHRRRATPPGQSNRELSPGEVDVVLVVRAK